MVYGVVVAVLFYIILGPSLGATLGGLGALVGLGGSVFVGLILGTTSYCMKIGDARRLSTPLERWTETERHVGNYRQSQNWAKARREAIAKKRAERKELSAAVKRNQVRRVTVRAHENKPQNNSSSARRFCRRRYKTRPRVRRPRT